MIKKAVTPTELRNDIYRLLDEILRTGVPQEIIRGSQSLLIVPMGQRRLDLSALPRREAMTCSPDELVETSWEHEWSSGL